MSCCAVVSMILGSHVLLSGVVGGRVVPILSCGHTRGSSRGVYWPASTIKLLPAIAVLRKGLNPRSIIRMRGYRGSIRTLLRLALSRSSNVAYDRLVDLVGMDYVNRTAGKIGLKHTWISRPYGRRGTFRYSPSYSLDGRYVKSKRSRMRNSKCRSNCTSFLDLQKMMVYAMRYAELRRWTGITRCQYRSAVRKRFPAVRMNCKAGFVANRHIIENGVFGKYALTIGMRSGSRKKYGRSCRRLDRLARLVLSCVFWKKR